MKTSYPKSTPQKATHTIHGYNCDCCEAKDAQEIIDQIQVWITQGDISIEVNDFLDLEVFDSHIEAQEVLGSNKLFLWRHNNLWSVVSPDDSTIAITK